MQKYNGTMKFIVTIKEKDVSLAELDGICNRYSHDVSIVEVRKSFCYDLRGWIENCLDISFSCVREVMNACQVVVRGSILSSDMEWCTITTFIGNMKSYLPTAWKNSGWPSCKDLQKYSDRDIIEKAKDLVVDKNAKKIIQAVLNVGTVNDVVTAGTLAQYYLEILRSIKIEFALDSYDPYKNKQYILDKALQELHYCDCVMQKTGEKIIEEKMKEYLTAQKEYWEQEDKLFKSNSTILSIYNRISLQQIIGFEN